MNHPLFFLGSLPYQSVPEAISFVKQYSRHLPFLPQLPEANPQEDMVGQVLRGIELGHWDEAAASCLELFQNEFVDDPRVKIQIAGPMTVARSLSADFREIAPSWLNFWAGLNKQLLQAGFIQEIWLQIDEPYWSMETRLPEEYIHFLGDVRKVRNRLKIGIHSCNKHRPEMDEVLVPFTDFFSFNFLDKALTSEELALWTQLLSFSELNLIMGIIPKGVPFESAWTPFNEKYKERIWFSPRCGLYDWTKEEIERTFCIGNYSHPLAQPDPSRINIFNAKKA